MSAQSVVNSIRSKYAGAFGPGAAAEIPTAYPNAPTDSFQVPTNPKDLPKGVTVWARLHVPSGNTERADLGTGPGERRYRTTGVAQVQLFGPLNAGEQDVLVKADAVATEFRDQTDSGVKYRTPTINKVGRSGAWWQVNVVLPWVSDSLA